MGYIDANNPPTCKRLHNDANLPIKSERLQAWLHQLTTRVPAEICRQEMPSDYIRADGAVFMEEDRAYSAFVYASVQFLKSGEREDGWHVTVFGSRTVLAKLEDAYQPSQRPRQRPRSFYVWDLCAVAQTTSDPVATSHVYAAARAVSICVSCLTLVCKRYGFDGWSCLGCGWLNGYRFNAGGPTSTRTSTSSRTTAATQQANSASDGKGTRTDEHLIEL